MKNGLEALQRKNFGFERRKTVWKPYRGKILLLSVEKRFEVLREKKFWIWKLENRF